MKKAVGTDFIPEQAKHLYLVKMEYEMQSSSDRIGEFQETVKLFKWVDNIGVIFSVLALLLLAATCIAQIIIRLGLL